MKSKNLLLVSIVCLSLFFAAPVLAFMSDNPPEISKQIRAMGNYLTPKVIGGTMKLYQPLIAASNKEGVKVTKDVAYGPHERHRMDLFEPEIAPVQSVPVLIFLHGGGFVRGDKAGAANIGYYFARHGVVAVTMNYRFAPEIHFPQGAEDVAMALRWVKENGKQHHADTGRIFLMGASAGATHVATYVFFENQQIPNDGVAGAILFSIPTANTSVLTDKDLVYYGKDKSKYPEMSVINQIDGRKIPVFVVYAELDMPTIQFQNLSLINALYDRDSVLPMVKSLMGHNHISETAHFNTPDESIGPDLLEFIKMHPLR